MLATASVLMTFEVLQLQPKQYLLKSEPDVNGWWGFIAQEVESIIPEAVFDTKEEIEMDIKRVIRNLDPMEYVQLFLCWSTPLKSSQTTIANLQSRLSALEG